VQKCNFNLKTSLRFLRKRAICLTCVLLASACETEHERIDRELRSLLDCPEGFEAVVVPPHALCRVKTEETEDDD